jgi:sulfite exporter TauE/SafE
MSTLSLTMALLMGITGSLHCVGMCGPIIWIMPFHAYSGLKKALALALYHTGRISVYAGLAVLLHSFRSFFNPHIQQYVSVAMGCVLLVVGILSFIPNHVAKFDLPWAAAVKKALGRTVGRPHLGAIGLAGTLNGLLPCGLVYMALSATMAAPSALQAAGLMYVFGVGTMPMLVAITLLKGKANFIRKMQVKKLVPVVVFVFGCLFVLRGMNLGVPYLSPKVTVEKSAIKSCCCHKK